MTYFELILEMLDTAATECGEECNEMGLKGKI